MLVKNGVVTIIENINNLIFIILTVSTIFIGSMLLVPEQILLASIAFYILLRLKYNRSVPGLNYILSFLLFMVIVYALKTGFLLLGFLKFYTGIIFLLLLARVIHGKDVLNVYRSSLGVSVGIICMFFYVVYAVLKSDLKGEVYLIPLCCLLVFMHIAVFDFSPKRSRKIGFIFAVVLICTSFIFSFRYVYSVYLINRSLAKMAKSDLPAAISDCKEAVFWMPFSSQAHHLLGGYYEAKGLEVEAADEYEKTMTLEPGNTQVSAKRCAQLAEFYLNNKQWEKAHIFLSNLVNLKPETHITDALPVEIKTLYDSIVSERQGHNKEAIERLRIYLNLKREYNDKDCYAHYRLAKLYRSCAEYGPAIFEQETALYGNLNNIEWRLELAALYKMTYKFEQGMRQYAEVLKRDPDSMEALTGYIESLLSVPYGSDALLIAQEFRDKYPDKAETHEILAKVYEYNGFFEKAVEEYKIFLDKTRPTSANLEMLGDYYQANYEFDKALKTYLKVLKLDPDKHSVKEKIRILKSPDFNEFIRKQLEDELAHRAIRLDSSPHHTSMLRQYLFFKEKKESYAGTGE